MIDFDGLQKLQAYNEFIALKKKVAEELKQAKQNCESLGIYKY